MTATLDAPVTSPLWRGLGVYSADELSLEDYHEDIVPGGSLSSSGARALLDPGCPAQFDYDRKHPQAAKKEFDLGTAAHTLILGNGADLVEVPAKRWDSIAVKAEVRAIRDAGKIPLKTAELEQVKAMAAALLRHPTAAAIFDPASGMPEQSMYWRDPITGVICRARPDWLRHPTAGRAVIPDYKGLALDTPIPTVDGWKTMRHLSVGDQVFDSNGRPCTVTHKSEVHMRKCYRIRFDDGSSVICDDEHLWVTTAGRQKRETAVRTTEQIRQTLKLQGASHHRVQVAGALQLPAVELPIHPYVLGCWLGDGHTNDGRISKPDEELFGRIAECGYKIGPIPPSMPKCPTRTIHGLRVQLRAIGLLGHKAIPLLYLRASFSQRLELLRGLMDTDGSWNSTRHQAVFTSTDKALALAVCELSCSLGQRAILHTVTQSGFGLTVEAYRVTFTPVNGLNPFALTRKASKVHVPTDKFSKRRVIVAVEEVPTVPTQCIAVDSFDRTYLCTESMIPTHNTAAKVDRKSIQKAIRDRGYHQQAAWCVEGARHVGIADEHAVFLLVFQAKNPPYHVVVAQVDALDLRIGHAKNAVARDIYRECTETGVWPAYGEGVEIISQPEWDQKQQAEEYL